MSSHKTRPLAADERGFALVIVILVIAVVATLVAAGFVTLAGERRTTADGKAQGDAFSLAQAGLEEFLASKAGAPSAPAAEESDTIALTGGVAYVELRRVRDDPAKGRNGYIIWSRGVDASARLQGAARAERTVAQYAVWHSGTMNVLSSWTSLTGLTKNGGSSMGSSGGKDQCSAAPDVAGVAVPTSPGFVSSPSSFKPKGSPPVQDLGSLEDAADQVSIDWEGILNGTALTPDIIIPGGAWPSSFPANYYPVILVNSSNFTLPSNGQGTLIVKGDVTFGGSQKWNGVLLVGGNIVSNGNNSVNGATVSGLNVKLGQTLPNGTVGNGTKDYNYDSCEVAKALSGFARLVPLDNAWVDNWPAYTY